MANGDEKSLDHSHSTNPIDGQEVSPTDYPPEVGDLTHDDMQGVAGAAGEAWSSFCVVAAGRPLPSTCASVQTSLRTLQARVTAALAKMPTAETDTVSVAAVSGTAGVAAATAVAADATQEMPGGSQKAFVPPSRLTFTRDSTAHKTKVASSSALRPSLSPDEMDHDGMPPAFKSGVFREGSSLVRPREEEAKGPGESAGDSQGRPLSKRRRTHGINQETRTESTNGATGKRPRDTTVRGEHGRGEQGIGDREDEEEGVPEKRWRKRRGMEETASATTSLGKRSLEAVDGGGKQWSDRACKAFRGMGDLDVTDDAVL